MNDREIRDMLIALTVSRQIVALHYLSGEDRELPCVVLGHIVKVAARTVVVATHGDFETPIPLASVTKLEPISGAALPTTEAA